MEKGSRFLEFKDEEGWDYIISFPVKDQEEYQKLRLWVSYEQGNRDSYYDNRFLYRGFYLYISLESTWELGRTITENKYNRRVFLGEVPRKSQSAYQEFAEKAGWHAVDMIEKYCAGLEIEQDGGVASKWSGNEADLGMWRENYTITHYW